MLQGGVQKNDGQNAARALYAYNGRGNQFLQGLVGFFYSGISAVAIPARLRLRKNFGERAFSPMAVIIGVLFFVYIFYNIIDEYVNIWTSAGSRYTQFHIDFGGLIIVVAFIIQPINLLTISLIRTLLLAKKHFQKTYSQQISNMPKYSFYRGDPIDEKAFSNKIGKKGVWGVNVDESIIRAYYEPRNFMMKYLLLGCIALVVNSYFFGANIHFKELIGMVFNSTSNIIAGITNDIYRDINSMIRFVLYTSVASSFSLFFSGLCLMAEEFSIRKRIRDTILDTIDAEYDMKFITEQKEYIMTENIERIAEDIYQNTDSIKTASFPT